MVATLKPFQELAPRQFELTKVKDELEKLTLRLKELERGNNGIIFS